MNNFVLFWLVPSVIAAFIAQKKGRSGIGYFFLSFFATPVIGLMVVIFIKSKNRQNNVSLDDLGISIHVTSSYGDDESRIKGRPSKSSECWIPPGKQVSVKGYEIPGGLLYVGKNLPAVQEWGGIEPALIDPSMPVSKKSPDNSEDMGYWPSYSQIRPSNRAEYLSWLAEGRIDPNINIGYVFLFFYGLERRALADISEFPAAKNEIPAIKAEVLRLLSIYNHSNSFNRYASEFLSFISKESLDDNIPAAPPEFPIKGYELPTALRLSIGRMAKSGIVLPADWALSWLRHAPDLYLRKPGERCALEFDTLFLIEYIRRYPNGIKLSDCKRKIQLYYRPASSSFGGQLRHTSDLPDITSLVGPKRKLQEISDWCSDELSSYSRYLASYPDKKGDLAAAALLPYDLLVNNTPVQLLDLKARIEQALSGQVAAVINAEDILAAWLPTDGTIQTKKMAVEGTRLIGSLGIGIEPDVRFGGRKISRSEEVVVFRLSEENVEVASPSYHAATVLMQLATMVSAADREISEDEERMLKDYIARGLHLTESEQIRLSAHLLWLLRNPPTSIGIKKHLEIIPKTQREVVGHFLVSVAWADGHVDPGEVKSLTKIYKSLGLDADLVHQHIHEIRAASDSGPVTVAPAEKEMTYKIPPERTAGVNLDKSKIAAMQKESIEVSRIIGEIFKDEEEDIPQRPDSYDETVETIGNLDEKHSQLLIRMGQKKSWKRSEYEALVEELDLFPDGALEILNEVAYDICDEPLTDGEDPIIVNQDIYREVTT